MRRILALAALSMTLAAPGVAQELASASELEDALAGNTFAGDMGSAQYTSFFAEDGTYYDASGSGPYEITEDGVCYPDTDFGCYGAVVDGETLTWYQDGSDVGSGQIMDGDAMNLMEAAAEQD